MSNLTNDELKNIKGGAINVAVVLGISAIITFAIGIIDGIVRPLKCHS